MKLALRCYQEITKAVLPPELADRAYRNWGEPTPFLDYRCGLK